MDSRPVVASGNLLHSWCCLIVYVVERKAKVPQVDLFVGSCTGHFQKGDIGKNGLRT